MSILSKLFGGGKRCPICGGEMTFLGSTQLEDEVICDNCIGKIKSETDIQLFWLRRGMDPEDPDKWDRSDTDPIGALTLEEAQEILRPIQDRNQAVIGAFSKAYSSLFFVNEVFPMVDLNTIAVGGKREKRFQNTTVVEPVPFDPDLSFETVIVAHFYKGPVKADKAAWLIIDQDGGLAPGDVIGKK